MLYSFLPKSSATTNKMFGGVEALQNGKKKMTQIQAFLNPYHSGKALYFLSCRFNNLWFSIYLIPPAA